MDEQIKVRIETREKGEGTDVFLVYPDYPFCKPEDAPETWVCWMRGKCLLHPGDGPGVEFVEMTLYPKRNSP